VLLLFLIWRTPAKTSDPHQLALVSTVTLASGLTLSYVERGDTSHPAVLLLPGPTDSWRSYQSVLHLLPHEIRAVCVSQRGHGESDKPESGYAVADFASDVVLLLDALAIERAVLTGHSGSCLVARRVALDHPNRVAGLILEASPTTLRDNEHLVGFVESVVSDLDDPISPDFVRSFVADTSSEDVPPEMVDMLVDEVLKVPARVWKQTLLGLLQYDDIAELGRIEAPTLLVWGDADAVVSRDMQDSLARLIPDAELLIYHGAGHTPRWEDPARFSGDLFTFARRVAPHATEGG
jgi:non-heme chloroperoxidase